MSLPFVFVVMESGELGADKSSLCITPILNSAIIF